MLRDGKDIELEAGQSIIVEAVGSRYTEFQGYKEAGGETRIGLSYDKLCQSVKPGNRILLADGSISIQVDQILSDTELRGTVLNSKKLGQRKNCNLPGVKVDIPVLTDKDIDDLQNFAAKLGVDYVAASFVQVSWQAHLSNPHCTATRESGCAALQLSSLKPPAWCPALQSAQDVRFIREVLDKAGGQRVRIISKIENAEVDRGEAGGEVVLG
jgi:pyruvate kinase